jgi:3D (Asp-Asp-Asp) domain-containing protein
MKHLKSRHLLVFLLPGILSFSGCHDIQPPANIKPIKKQMLTTGYCACQKCTGWRRTWYGMPVYASGPNKGKRKLVGVTASGTHARKGTIAADTGKYPFGTIMYIPDYGYGRVEDRGGKIKGEHIDLFFSKHQQALNWGRQKKTVLIWFVSNQK